MAVRSLDASDMFGPGSPGVRERTRSRGSVPARRPNMQPKTVRRKSQRKSRGTALPAILALSVGVGALAAGFASQNLREHQREAYEKNRARAYLDAWAQMEVVSELVDQSPYDMGTGENLALKSAAARGDTQFIDRDGYATGVTCVN